MIIVLMYIIQINVIHIVSRTSLDHERIERFESLKNKLPLLIIVNLYIKKNLFADNFIGDACWHDYDNDTVKNIHDNCPNNSLIWATDFRKYTTIALDPFGTAQEDPVWVIHNDGAEIQQLVNSDPGIAIGNILIFI